MRRFERLMQRPVLVREIDVAGASVVIREGITELVATTHAFATAAEAERHAETLIAQWRAEGFVPITRLAPVAPETAVRRDARRDWNTVKSGRVFREVLQNDHKTREIAGRVVNGADVDRRTETREWTTIREASAVYEQLVASMHREADAEERAYGAHRVRTEQKLAARKEARRRARFEQHRHADLEAQCRAAARDDASPWAVYADWLIEQGDRIGEAAIQAMRGDAEGARGLLLSTTDELHPDFDDSRVDFELVHGFIRSVSMKVSYRSERDALPELVKKVLSSPACRFVDSLRLGLAVVQGHQNDWGPTLATICDLPQAATLRELRLDDFDATECELSWVGYGDLAFAWPKLPVLELLHIRAGLGGNLGDLDLPNLRTFIRESGGLRRADLQALYARPRPRLEHLELWTGRADYGAEIGAAELDRVLAAAGFPRLAHLGIVNSELSDELVPLLASSHVLPRLSSLDLSKGIFAKVATDALVARAAQFRHLASLDLSENVLYDDEIEAIRGVLDNAILVDQRPEAREDDFPDDPGERYTAVGE